MTEYLPVGTRVIYDRTNVLERANVREQAGYPITKQVNGQWKNVLNSRNVTARTVKRWFRSINMPYRIMTEENTGLIQGVIVGVRTITSGFTDGGWDEPYSFIPVEYHRVYLVAHDLFRKPHQLLLGDVRPEATQPEQGSLT